MGCCAAAEGNSIFKKAFSLIVILFTGFFSLALLPMSFIPRVATFRKFFLSVFTSFSEGFREDLKRPLIGGTIHCRLSGRILHTSPWLSGVVYNYFNLFLILPVLVFLVIIWYMV